MNINWEITGSDITKAVDFINTSHNPYVENRINRNIRRIGIRIDKDTIIRSMLMCLLSGRHDSSPDSNVGLFFRNNPFPLSYKLFSKEPEIENMLRELLKINGLTQFMDRIPGFFAYNFSYLDDTEWELQKILENYLNSTPSKIEEREIADNLDQVFKGFGSKQARNFLQALGLSMYEIPIDLRMINWLKEFGFPVSFSHVALQDKSFYHFISDGIQLLCEKAGIYPCVLEAAVFSAYDHARWIETDVI